jgi:3-dehydroquinate synthase
MKIYINEKILTKINQYLDLNSYTKLAVLTDEVIGSFWLNKLKEGLKKDFLLIILKPGEKEKNLKTLTFIWQKLLENNFDRKSLLLNFGGGVITDLGGFTASTYMRGIDYINFPTTILGAVDASIGGKTGINFLGVKNLIGTFYEPKMIFIDTFVFSSLPKREFIAGFAEIIKHAIIADQKYFDFLLKVADVFDQKNLKKVIDWSIKIKTKIVQKDKKEKGLRKILNFGHTLGHAIESLSLKTKKPLLHGEAVALGMIGESFIAQKIGLLKKEDFFLIEEIIKKYQLFQKINLSKVDFKRLMINDKKNINQKILFSLPEKIGKAVFNVEVSEKIINLAIDYINL